MEGMDENGHGKVPFGILIFSRLASLSLGALSGAIREVKMAFALASVGMAVVLVGGLATQDGHVADTKTLPDTRTERVQKPLQMGDKLWVSNLNGWIKVVGWDKAEILLEAEIRDAPKRRVDLQVQTKEGGIEVIANFEQAKWYRSLLSGKPSPRCEMTLHVPMKLQGHFRTTNGNVNVSDISGYVKCRTTNGDLHIQKVSGEVHADTTNGTVNASGLKARIKGGTTNGRIVLENVEGGIKMETTNGGIRAINLDGWGEGIRLETTNGGIEVELGKATGEVVAKNTNGSLDIEVKGNLFVKEKRRVHVKIPGRNQNIHLETTNGSIKVR